MWRSVFAVFVVALVGGSAHAQVSVTVSPEMPIAPRLVCPAETSEIGLAHGPAGGVLAVWIEDRWYQNYSTDIYAGRVDATGAMLDPRGILIADSEETSALSTAYDASTSSWIVAWRGYTGGIGGTTGVFARRLDSSGALLDLVPVAIDVIGTGDDATTAASPGQFLVVWGTGTQLLARRIGSSGLFLDAVPIVLGTAGYMSHPSALFDGTNYVVVWGSSGIQGVRVSTSGTVLPPGQVSFASATNGERPSLVQGGTELLLAWHAGSLYQMRVSASLAPLDSPHWYIGGQDEEGLTFDGTRYMILDAPGTQDSSTLSTHYLSATNAYLGSDEYTAPGHTGYDVGAVFTGTKQLVGFTSNLVMHGLRIALDGTFLDTTPPVWSTTLNDQSFADIAYDPTDGHLAVWRDGRDDDNNNAIYAARITPSGSLDGGGVRVSGAGTYENNALAVAHGRGTGAPFVVVWHHDPQPSFRAARIDGTGHVIDPGGFELYTDPNLDVTDDYRLFSNNLACTAVSCLFAWFDGSFQVKAIRFRLDGTIIDSTPITIASSSVVHVTATSNGFLVLLGNRGYLVPETGPGSSALVNLPGAGGVSDSLWDGHQFVLAWGVGTDIKITRLDVTAHEIGPRQTVPVGSNQPYALRVIQDGADATVVWWTDSAVRAARYTSTGTLRDPTGVSIANASSLQVRIGDAAAGAFPIIEQHDARHPPGVGLWETVRWASITGMGSPSIDAGVNDASIVVADAFVPDGAVIAPADAAVADAGVMLIDAAAPTADAMSSPVDAATTGPDAIAPGFDEAGSGAGCCQGGSSTNGVLAIAILSIVLRRRRRHIS